MGFGFNLFAVFILFPISIILVIAWLFSRSNLLLKILIITWGCVFSLIAISWLVETLTMKKNLHQEDIYGDYVIDKTKFAGPEANWQYDHFRFSITTKNKFVFYITNKDKIVCTYTGDVSISDVYTQPRITIAIPEPGYHLIDSTPTLYRTHTSFYYVFKSPKFGNVFFTKGKWRPQDD
jgi:hypothetical protein